MEDEARQKAMKRLRWLVVIFASLCVSVQAIKLVTALMSWVTALWLLLVVVVSIALGQAWYVFAVDLHKRGSKWLPAYVVVYMLAGILITLLAIWRTFFPR